MAKVTFDDKNPDVKLIRQVLHQAFDGGTQMGAIDAYGDAWCLSEMDLDDWRRLESCLLKHRLICEPGQPGFYALTERGRRFYEEREMELPAVTSQEANSEG